MLTAIVGLLFSFVFIPSLSENRPNLSNILSDIRCQAARAQSLTLCPAPGNRDRGSVNEPRLVAREKNNDARNILGLRPFSKVSLGHGPAVCVSIEDTWKYCICADSAAFEICCQGVDHGHGGRLGCGIGGRSGWMIHGRTSRNIHDGATPLLQHDRDDDAAQHESGPEIECEHLLENL